MTKRWGRLTIEVDFGLDLVIFRCNGREIDLTPTMHVASDARDRLNGLRRTQALGDQDGFPPDAVQIRFLADSPLPDDVREQKQQYFAQWWRMLLDLAGIDSWLPLKPRVRVFIRSAAARATQGQLGEMLEAAVLSAGANSVELTEEGHSSPIARTG